MPTMRSGRTGAAHARALDNLWAELSSAGSKGVVSSAAARRSPRPSSATAAVRSPSSAAAAAQSRRRQGAPRGKRQQSVLLRLPLEALEQILRHVPAMEHVRMAHVCRQLRASLLAAGDAAPSAEPGAAKFWSTVANAHWAVDGGDRALHCRQLEVVVLNAKLLCSQALRQALSEHYTTALGTTGGRGPPRLERCDRESGCPAIYKTDRPLSLCLMLSSEGLVLGLAIFVTFRFFVPETDSQRDVRNYIAIKRGQRVASGEHRFRICGEHSELMRGVQAGEIALAVVQRQALVQLDPRRHSVAHALTHLDVDASQSHSEGAALDSRMVAVLSHTQRLIQKSYKKTRRPARLL